LEKVLFTKQCFNGDESHDRKSKATLNMFPQMVKDDPKGLICAVVEIQGILAQNLGRKTLKCDNFQWENHL